MKQSRAISQTRTNPDFLNRLLIATLMLCCCIVADAGEKPKQNKLASATNEFEGTLININQVSAWIYADGKSGISPNQGGGITYPRGTATVVFQDGLLWGGLVQDGDMPVLRAGGSMYNVGHVPGRIIAPGVAEDKTAPEVNRVWRIRRDYMSADLRQDAAELLLKPAEEVTSAEIADLRQRYAEDWQAWPWQKGAPFYDADGDGVYSPRFAADGSPILFPEADEPGLADADQVVWLVVNDLDTTALDEFTASRPIGLEIQMTFWGYDRSDALGNIIFRRHRLIYRGASPAHETPQIDSMYVSQWVDPDVGSAFDDLAGVDTLLNLGFAYNSAFEDPIFVQHNLPPPAIGYKLVAGPIFPSAGKQAIFELRKINDYRNLPMTMFATLSHNTYIGPFGTYSTTQQLYNMLRGFLPRPETPPQPFIDPTTGEPTKFTLYGDPITGEGWVDQGSGDRRFLFSSGPFTMALGDTQEVTIAFIGASASDRLESVALLKHYARAVQQSFDNLLEMPQPPPAPQLAATEFDGRILLDWSREQDHIERVEQSQSHGFRFEGYNVYQLPSAISPVADGVKLATFDLDNNVTNIHQDEFDPAAGVVLTRVVQSGPDEGVQRTFLVERDSLNQSLLYNGQTYHFAVTAYSYNPDPLAALHSLESPPARVTVRPQALAPGKALQSSRGDTLFAEHESGDSEGEVFALVVDPTAITGDNYRVVFENDSSGETTWHLLNSTRGDTVLRNQKNQSGDGDYLVADGLQVKVIGVEPNIAGPGEGDGMVEVRADDIPLNEPDFDSAGAPYGGNKVWHSLNANGFSDRYYVGAGGGPGDISQLTRNIQNALTYQFEMRFTTLEQGSFGWWAFSDGSVHRVPLTLWNIGKNTIDDPSDDVQLIPVLFSDGSDDDWDVGGVTDPMFGFPCTDWIYWYSDPRGYAAFEADAQDGVLDDPTFDTVEYFARMILCDFDGNGRVAGPGYVIRIHTTKPNSSADVFAFSTAGYEPTFSLEKARQNVDKITVFPNPYVGIHRFETRFPSGFVTFSHLPQQATIRIFTLAGALVRKLEKSEPGQFLKWDLKNESGRTVGGGVYIAHVEMPELGATKVLKLVVVPE